MPGPNEDRKPTSWTARVIAPVVLVIVAAAIALVISGSLSDGDDDSRGSKQETTTTDCNPDADQAVDDGYYVVQADDVQGLSGIADKTCIPIETLIELNPNLDPQALQAENCVDLVVDGCKELAAG
jgi:hypothetical protein